MRGGSRALATAAVLALLAPLAAAGSEASPDGVDPRDQDDPRHDILAFWIEETPRGLKWTIKLAGAPTTPTAHVYAVAFWVGSERHSMGVGFDGQGRMRSSVDTPSGWFTRVDDSLVDLEWRRGAPAYVGGTLPWGRLPDVKPGAVLREVGASVAYDPGDGSPWVAPADAAGSPRMYRVGSGSLSGLESFLEQPGVPAVLIIATTMAGAWGGLGAWRRLRGG